MANAFNELPTETARRFMGVAPVDLDGMATALGLAIRREPLAGGVAGQIQLDSGNYVITLNSKEGPRRQRFTLAHEIAHYLLHRGLIEQGVVDSVMYRSNLSNELARQANRYAADLLMPADLVRRAWRSGECSYIALAEKFNVSPDAARIRLQQLGFGA